MCRKYEKEGLFAAWLTQPMVFIFGEEYVKQILTGPGAIYKPKVYKALEYFLKNSILHSNGEKWKRQKKIVLQAFQFTLREKKIQIYNKHSHSLVKTLSSLPNNTTNDVLDIMKQSTIQVITESMFGIELSNRERSSMINAMEMILTLSVERFFKPWLYPDFSLNIFPEGRKCLKVFNGLKVMLSEMMENTKKNMLAPKNHPADLKFIGEILFKKHLEDPSFTMDELMAQILLLFFAAFETTSLSLMWCLHLLGHHEEVQERLYLEVENLEEDLGAEALRKMEYTECVIRESLRMYATIPLIFKYLTEDVQCGKYTIPKGSTILLALFMLHKNSDMFPDPEKFDPERFWQMKNGDPRQLYTASFAEGVRPCLGKADALNQMKIVIAYIVRNFKVISLDKQKDVEVFYEILLNSVKPLRMQFIPRRVIKDDDMFSTAKI